jgi:hypothetical protein
MSSRATGRSWNFLVDRCWAIASMICPAGMLARVRDRQEPPLRQRRRLAPTSGLLPSPRDA